RTQRAQRKRPDKAQRDLCVLLRLCKKNARPSNPKKDFSRVMDGSFQGYGTLLNLNLLRAWHGALLNTTTIAEATAPSPCEARAGRGLGRGAPSIELALLIGIPSPLPSPHSSVVGRGNRPATWWCRVAPHVARDCLRLILLRIGEIDTRDPQDTVPTWRHYQICGADQDALI